MTATKIHLNNNKHNIIIAAIYRPQNSDLQYIDDMCNSIEDSSSRNRNYVLWVGGNLNLPDINWPDCTMQGNLYPIDINQCFLYPRHTGGAMPLRFLIKTAITAVTPPVVFLLPVAPVYRSRTATGSP